MDHDPTKSLHDAPLMEFVSALESIRDSFVLISLSLKDILAEMPSPEKVDVDAEVDSFLNRVRVSSKDSCE